MRSCGWIVATGALGTGINIKDIIFVIHIDRPYGSTSFAQQSGRGGRGREVSDSIVVVRVKTTSGRRRREVLSEYYVKHINEEAMTEFLQVKGYRRQVMAKHFNGETGG
jgi:superfamily II DNA helicase RecQ